MSFGITDDLLKWRGLGCAMEGGLKVEVQPFHMETHPLFLSREQKLRWYKVITQFSFKQQKDLSQSFSSLSGYGTQKWRIYQLKSLLLCQFQFYVNSKVQQPLAEIPEEIRAQGILDVYLTFLNGLDPQKKEANLQQLSLLLQEKQTVPHIFKYLILIHRLVMQETPHSQLLLRVLGKLKWYSSDRIEESMSVKLIKPFQLYLQKRVLFTICALTQGYSEDGETRVYRLINLLHFGTSFANMLYILGRYYQRQWIPEFNIGLCMDLRAIYDALTYSMSSPPTREILDEIQLLHQKLYLAFYNCYFHRYLKNFVPKWIKTDYGVVTPTKSRNKMSQKTRSQSLSTKNKSTVQSEKNIPISSSKIDLEQSSCCLFGNQSLIQSDKIELDESFLEDEQGENMERLNTSQKRTELIKDMERIVSMFAQ